MTLRTAYAAALQQLRVQLGRLQHEAAGKIDQSHVSRLERGISSASVSTTAEIAEGLGVQPVSLLALAFAAHERIPAKRVLLDALAELERLELADEIPPSAPTEIPSPLVQEAQKKWAAVQKQKLAGATQKETAVLLGIPKSTVGRLWNKDC